jgi:hypothetical protein
MTENPINTEDGVWTDSFTESYIEIAEEEEDDECCNLSTPRLFAVLTVISLMIVGCICYVVVTS